MLKPAAAEADETIMPHINQRFGVAVCTHVCVAAQVIQDFADEGCVYLELRTTPKVYSGCHRKDVGTRITGPVHLPRSD